MKPEKGEFVYDYRYDVLTFRIKNSNYKMSKEFQNFVADIDDRNRVAGIRVFDASQVFGVDKIALKNIVYWTFKSTVENNVITIIIKFAVKMRNRIFPLISGRENFFHQITTPAGELSLANSAVTCLA